MSTSSLSFLSATLPSLLLTRGLPMCGWWFMCAAIFLHCLARHSMLICSRVVWGNGGLKTFGPTSLMAAASLRRLQPDIWSRWPLEPVSTKVLATQTVSWKSSMVNWGNPKASRSSLLFAAMSLNLLDTMNTLFTQQINSLVTQFFGP